MITAITHVSNPIVDPEYFSATNGGAKIPGRGVSVLQQHGSAVNANTTWAYVITDRTAVYASAISMSQLGSYDDLFYQFEGNRYYHGKPERFEFFGTKEQE